MRGRGQVVIETLTIARCAPLATAQAHAAGYEGVPLRRRKLLRRAWRQARAWVAQGVRAREGAPRGQA